MTTGIIQGTLARGAHRASSWASIRVIWVAASLALLMIAPVVPSAQAISPTLGQTVAPIAAGGAHSCAVTDAGAVKCWGENSFGQLGDGTNIRRYGPVAVSNLGSGVVAIAAGTNHSCALTDVGAVKCWGNNSWGQLGNGINNDDRWEPVAVSGLGSGVVAIAAGWYHSCALTDAGAVKCWGNNVHGQLGDGSTISSNVPVAVSDFGSGVVAIAAGKYHSCAVTDAGAVWCWGSNSFGQLGDGGTNSDSNEPVAVWYLESGVVAIGAGGYHSCAVTDAGAVWCWGFNANGQLGDGTNSNSYVPVAVWYLESGVVAIAAGGLDFFGDEFHSCALTDAGAVKCWGRNYDGQLGNRSYLDTNEPVAVWDLGSGVIAIAAGGYHSCALTDAGAVKCWGSNAWGQLGACEAGSYLATVNEPCTPAEAGHYVDTTGATTQTACSLGTYQDEIGQTSCKTAEAGYYVDTAGATTQTACSPGTYQDANGQTSCKTAEAGYYVDTAGATTQTACPPNTTTASTGSDSASDCVPVRRTLNVSVTGSGDVTSSPLDIDCPDVDCEADFAHGTEVTLSAMPASGWGFTGWSGAGCSGTATCVVTMDQARNVSATFGAVGAPTATISSPAGGSTYRVGQVVGTTFSCTEGSNGPGIASCTDSNGQTDGTGTLDTSVAGAASYTVTALSQAGQSDTDTINYTVVTPCQPGTYSTSGDDRGGACTPASAGHYVDTAGATTQTACSPGTYQPNTSQTSCLAAGVGYYVDTTGATSQTACPPGQTTAGTGSDSASDCFGQGAVTPYARKERALASLQAMLPSGDATADGRLRRAITNISKSITPWRWNGEAALNPRHGWKVFNFEKRAVTWLWFGSLVGNPVVNAAINDLVAADRELVVNAIAASTDPAAVAKANRRLGRADALIAQHLRGPAIYYLRQAWLAVAAP